MLGKFSRSLKSLIFHKINKAFEEEIILARIELWCDADRRAKLDEKELAFAPTIGEILAMTI